MAEPRHDLLQRAPVLESRGSLSQGAGGRSEVRAGALQHREPYDERGDYDRALRHYQEAVRLHPSYADAHYNLALLFQGSGHVMEAVRHWKTYLKLDPTSSWAAIARRELDKLRRYTVVAGKRVGWRLTVRCSNSLIVGPRGFSKQTAIHPDRLARDEIRGIARQKRDHARRHPRAVPTRPSGVSFDHVPA